MRCSWRWCKPKRIDCDNAGVVITENPENTFNVSGASVTPGVKDTELFPPVTYDKELIEVVLKDILPSEGSFTIVQTNPALEAYKDDSRISEVDGKWVKTATYTGDPEDKDLAVILQEGESEATIVVDGTTTYTINSNFAVAE